MGFLCFLPTFLGRRRWHISKEPARDVGLIPGLGRSPGVGNGNLFQYSCLKNLKDRGAWQATVHGLAKSRTQLSNFPFTFHLHAWEKEMAPHSSVLAWRTPGMGEPVGVAQSQTRLTRLSSSSSSVGGDHC